MISQIQWSGLTWNVKSGTSGPGPNHWSADSSNVWVDDMGNLHLKITKIGENWFCAEIYSQQSFGYGEYTFQIESNVGKLDKNIVLGLFTYKSDAEEIDIEFSRWGKSENKCGWYTVQPEPYDIENQKSFDLHLEGDFSTHKFIWNPAEIIFQSYHGHYPILPGNEYLINDWKYRGAKNPLATDEKVQINLWLFKGKAPSDLKEAEVIITSFTYN